MIVPTMLIGMEFTTLKLQIGLLHNTISQSCLNLLSC
ncbi:unnamed protein product [Brassica rapa]|uniref:Uncharacterized protein n=2 Tax=Brassica TaxID=3705 RepID=A0A8D9GK31_BRACM|nr:unnamed protein product [Brassica napus]CAF2126301.1 unnamed protein product [Brassica napus]CAG7882065.1 unnamed protein product [Brassica rapa]CDY40699.1 BnaC03g34150D [Brassica napus]